MGLTTRGRTEAILIAKENAKKLGDNPMDAAQKAAEHAKKLAIPVNHKRLPRFVG